MRQSADCNKDMARKDLIWRWRRHRLCKGNHSWRDDGIAVAIALALLDAEDIAHPRLEAVFTVDEETGMLGAVGMKDVSMLRVGRC